MAERTQRSMNDEMNRGAVDGLYKQPTPDWSSNTATVPAAHVRGELCSDMYGTMPLAPYDTMPLGPGIPKGTA